MLNAEYKSYEELFNEALAETRQLSVAELKRAVKFFPIFHPWAVQAYKQALKERESAQ